MFKLPTFGKKFKEQSPSERAPKSADDKKVVGKKSRANAKAHAEKEEKHEHPTLVLEGETGLAYIGIKAPMLTEKSERLKARENKYVFKVAPDATKGLVRHAIELLYKVKVTDVNMTRTAGKNVRRGRTVGYKSGVKKAIVTLRAGQTINVGM